MSVQKLLSLQPGIYFVKSHPPYPPSAFPIFANPWLDWFWHWINPLFAYHALGEETGPSDTSFPSLSSSVCTSFHRRCPPPLISVTNKHWFYGKVTLGWEWVTPGSAITVLHGNGPGNKMNIDSALCLINNEISNFRAKLKCKLA